MSSKTHLFFFAVAALLLPFVGCTSSTAPTPKASIQGKVYFQDKPNDSLTALAGASVFTNPPTSVVKTNAQGNYVLDVPPGRYTLRAINNSDTCISSDTVIAISGQADTVNLSFPLMFFKMCKQLQTGISDAAGCVSIPITFAQTSSTVISANGLSLTLSIDTTTYQQGQQISISIAEKNILATENSVNIAGTWPVQGLNVGPCGTLNYPFGISILQGYYDSQNVASISPLQLSDPNAIYHCPMMLAGITAYDFQPSSDSAAIYTSYNSPPFSIQMTAKVTSTGYWGGSSQATFSSFLPGIYTVVGGDEWGALVVLHFVVS
jgi:hypothetical protein